MKVQTCGYLNEKWICLFNLPELAGLDELTGKHKVVYYQDSRAVLGSLFFIILFGIEDVSSRSKLVHDTDSHYNLPEYSRPWD